VSKSVVVYEIETARLDLQPLTPAAAAALHTLWTHPEVRRFLWDDEVIPPEKTASIIATSTKLFSDNGFGLWGMRLRDGKNLIGFGGYWFFRDPPELELLYGVAAERWDHGFATEAARALVRYGFETLQFPEVRGSTDALNGASVRVLEKAGLQFDRRAATAGLDTVHYRLKRTAFQPDNTPYRLRAFTLMRE
jgi:ribosomal-protein-alanine N-acetyltransferase